MPEATTTATPARDNNGYPIYRFDSDARCFNCQGPLRHFGKHKHTHRTEGYCTGCRMWTQFVTTNIPLWMETATAERLAQADLPEARYMLRERFGIVPSTN